MKIIRDAIHGNIEIPGGELKILDTPEMQRLRSIKQLGFTYLVYPSATHTRFEHSLGTFYLADQLGRKLKLEQEDAQKLRIAALLHDVGHGPFSHSSEDAIKLHIHLTQKHESMTVSKIKEGELSDCIKELGLDPGELAKIATGRKKPLSEIISGEIDIDRMDYLVRDSYYTGAAYGVIDLERLLGVLKLGSKGLILKESGLAAAESLVRARYLMFPAVYNHHTTRIINAMFSTAILSCLRDGLFTADELYGMDDIDLISKLRGLDTFAGEMMQRIEQRRLYKRALVLDKEDLGKNYKKLLGLSATKLESLETELRDTCKLGDGELLLDIPEPLYTEEANASIMSKGKTVPLQDVSLLVKTLEKAQWAYWNVGVYCAGKNVQKVKKRAREVLMNY